MAGRKKDPGDQLDGTREEGGFLSRWSRRKSEAKTADDAVKADLTADPAAAAQVETSEKEAMEVDQHEAAAIDPATLPDIDSLGPGSDFSVFMQAGVPPSLKTKALRRLWQVKPELANLDGLIDYGEDLTGSFKVVDQLKTAYEVGRGFLRDAEDEAEIKQGDVVSEADQDETADARQSEDGGSQEAEKTAKPDPEIPGDDSPADKT